MNDVIFYLLLELLNCPKAGHPEFEKSISITKFLGNSVYEMGDEGEEASDFYIN